jgi:hypothetical protein
MFSSLSRLGLYFALLATCGALSVTYTQGQNSSNAMVYENRNQIDPEPLKIDVVHGVAKADDGSAIVDMEVGIFTDSDHALVATTRTDEKGRFSFPRLAVGKYRLVAKHPAFCTANVPVLLKPGSFRHADREIELHMKVGGVDVCSFGSLIPVSHLNVTEVGPLHHEHPELKTCGLGLP